MPILDKLLFDLGFSNQAGFYFRNWEYSLSDAQKPLSYTLGLILVAVLIYLAYLYYRKKTLAQKDFFTLRDPDRISAFLEQSVSERAAYEIQFEGEGRQRMLFSCAPVALEPDRGIVLETSGFVHPRQTWVGRHVRCHFKVSSGEKDHKWFFLQFSSTISAVRKTGNLDFIVLALPERLERKQRRAHLRLEPLSGDIPALNIWPETLGHLIHPGDTPPILSFVHGQSDNQLNVVNVSAGGVLLEIRSSGTMSLGDQLDKGKRLFILMQLRDPEQSDIIEHMLLAQVRNTYTDPATGFRIVGLSFIGHHTSDEEKPGEHVWSPLHGKGLEDIEDWVFKRHLQLYREKGIV